jgi:hypothetical protein
MRLTTLPPSCGIVMKSGNLNFLEPSGPPRPVMGLLYLFYNYNGTSVLLCGRVKHNMSVLIQCLEL